LIFYHWNVVVVKVVCDRLNVLLVVVVPPALVVGQTELRRQRGVAGEDSVLTRHVLRLRPEQDEDVHGTGLGNPVSLDLRLGLSRPDKVRDRAENSGRVLLDVDPSLGRVQPEKSGRSNLVVRDHEGDGGVEGHRVPDFVLEDVQVVKAVRIAGAGVGQAEPVCVLRNAVHVFGVDEREVHRDGRRSLGLGVRGSAEGFLPHVGFLGFINCIVNLEENLS